MHQNWKHTHTYTRTNRQTHTHAHTHTLTQRHTHTQIHQWNQSSAVLRWCFWWCQWCRRVFFLGLLDVLVQVGGQDLLMAAQQGVCAWGGSAEDGDQFPPQEFKGGKLGALQHALSAQDVVVHHSACWPATFRWLWLPIVRLVCVWIRLLWIHVTWHVLFFYLWCCSCMILIYICPIFMPLKALFCSALLLNIHI